MNDCANKYFKKEKNLFLMVTFFGVTTENVNISLSRAWIVAVLVWFCSFLSQDCVCEVCFAVVF